VSPPAAAELARLETVIPPDAETIVSLPVVGRFAQRDSVYAFMRPGQTFPVDRRLVVIILGPHEAFDAPVTAPVLQAATGFVDDRLGARVLGDRSGVHAFAWSPRPGTRSVTLP
jgi:hypothetical protein